MAIYTSYEMISDCRAGKAEGWLFLVRQFVPPLRWLLGRYGQGEAELRALLTGLQNGGIQKFQPMVHREFIAGLRPEPASPGEPPFELSVLTEAMTDVPVLERQNLWLDAMGYEAPLAAKLLRQSTETAEKARGRMLELLRGKLDSWSRTILRDHGPALGAAARAEKPAEPVPFRQYLDILDGRMTWQNRVGVERALLAHWYEIDQFCRVREADAAITETAPYEDNDPAAQPYLDLLGVKPPKPTLLKRLLTRG
jgi:hypothetical protein